MGSTVESITSLAMIFVMIIPGIIAAKTNMIREDQNHVVSSIVVNITFPCLIVDALQVEYAPDLFSDIGKVAAIVLGTFFLAVAIGIVMRKTMKMEGGTDYIVMFMLIFSNCGFMGMPIVNAIYGKDGLFYASLLEMVSDIFMFTVGIMLIQAAAGQKMKMELKGLLTPGFISVLIGIALLFTGTSLPGFLGDSVEIIGSATSPLSMIAIGLQLGHMKFKDLIGDYRMYIVSAVRLIVLPMVAFVVLVLIMGNTSLLVKVMVLEIAMPAAACSTLFSQQYGADADFATKGVMLSTVLSIFTLCIFVVLLGGL